MDDTEQNGNCLLGAILLMWRLRSLRLRVLWYGRIVPHFYVKDKDGKSWHFKLRDDLLPWPICYLWFRGRFEQMIRREDYSEAITFWFLDTLE